jgi:hypothetical protein
MKKTLIAAFLGSVLSATSATAGQTVGKWVMVDGKENTDEVFYSTYTLSKQVEGLGFGMVFSSTVDCAPMLRLTVLTPNVDQSGQEDGPAPIGNDGAGMYIKVDKNGVFHFENGFYNHGKELFLITVKPDTKLLEQILAGNTLGIKIGNLESTFSLSGSRKANSMAYQKCENNKGRVVKDDSFFDQVESKSKSEAPAEFRLPDGTVVDIK